MAELNHQAVSDEQDILQKVTSPLSWLFLLAMTALVAVVAAWSFMGRLSETITAKGVLVSSNTGVYAVSAEADGTVTAMYCEVGDKVYPGDKIMQIKTDTGNEIVYADQMGYVTEILRDLGKSVKSPDNEVVRIRPEVNDSSLVLVCYVSVKEFKKIDLSKSPIEVNVTPSGKDSRTFGHMTARVVNVGTRAENKDNLSRVLGEDNNLDTIISSDNIGIVAIACELLPDDSSSNGFYWTTEKGCEVNLDEIPLWDVRIRIKEEPPIVKMFAKLSEIWEEKES